MVGKSFFAADKRESRRPKERDRWFAPLRALRLNAFTAARLLAGVALLATVPCSADQMEQKQIAPNDAAEDAVRQERIRGFLETARRASSIYDWDTVLANVRSALELDPKNTVAKELQWRALVVPLPEKREGDFKYRVVQGEVVITGYAGNAAEVTIPVEMAGMPVVRVGEGVFFYCRAVREVIIPDSVASIGENAFCGCKNLRSVMIGDSVTHIGPGAFGDCTRLKSIAVAPGNMSFRSIDGVLFSKDGSALLAFPVGKKDAEYTIPDSVTRIGKNAFSDSNSLKTVTIGDSVTRIGEQAFGDCDGLVSIVVAQGNTSFRSIDGVLFSKDGRSLLLFPTENSQTEYAIDGSVTRIEGHAFDNCSNLTAVTIGDSVTHIGPAAFRGCRSLHTVTIPDSVTKIEAGVFCHCQSLATVTIPGSVTHVGVAAFAGCRSLKTVTIPDSVTKIDTAAFSGCRSLTEVTIGDSVTSIGAAAFADCTNLKTVTIPDAVTNIDAWAFRDCTSLTEVKIGDSVTSIGAAAFVGCKSLKTVTIPDSVEKIDQGAFKGCMSLTEVTIGDSVTSIGAAAFAGCKGLKTVNIPDSVEIGPDVFKGCPWRPARK